MSDATKQDTTENLHCPTCDYDLTGLPDNRCPECGKQFNTEELQALREIKPIRVVQFIVVLVAVPVLTSTLLVLSMNYGDIFGVVLMWIGSLIAIGCTAVLVTIWTFKKWARKWPLPICIPFLVASFVLSVAFQGTLWFLCARTMGLLGWIPNPGGWSRNSVQGLRSSLMSEPLNLCASV